MFLPNSTRIVHCKPLSKLTAPPSPLAHSAHSARSAHSAFAALALAAGLLLQALPVLAQTVTASPLAANSQAEPRLASQLVMSLVVMDGKAEKLKAAPSVQPGDLLQYTAHYGNPTAATMRDVVSTVPVPVGTQWVPSSDQPHAAQASVDGRDYGPLPLTRKQLQANGQWVQVPVPVAEIRYLRWPARALAAGESFDASLRVRVLTSDAVNAALSNTNTSTSAAVSVPNAVDPSRSQVAAR
jgi:hypothetical protein